MRGCHRCLRGELRTQLDQWRWLITAMNLCRCREMRSALGDAVRSSARTLAPEPEERPLGVRRSQGGCAVVGGRGLAVSAQPTK
jgi:hypothetical protein